MNLSKFPVYVQAAVLALVLALLGYLVAQALQFSLKVEVILPPVWPLAVSWYRSSLTVRLQPPSNRQPAGRPVPYIGNLPYRANEIAVRELFAEQGQVLSVRLMKDKATGKRRGFGFVEMPVADAAKAIAALNDKEYQQRT